MSTYGNFEAIEEIFPGRAGSILLAKSVQTSNSGKFAVKTFKPPVSVLGANAAEQSLKRFLVRAQLQQNLGELPGSMWAPILETGRADREGFYVTRHYSRSIQALIGGGVRLPAKGLHAVITGVVIGLEQIRKLASRSHGNLKPGNILIDGRGLIQPGNIALADPASDNIATAGGDAADLAAIGQLIHQIITGRDAYTGSDWSPQGASEWAHLGPRATQWRDFCRRLVEGNEDSPTIETIGSELRKLRPSSKTLKRFTKVAAVLAISAAVAFSTVPETRVYHKNLKDYQDDVAEMQPAWSLIHDTGLIVPPAVRDFYDANDGTDLNQSIVFPLISLNVKKLDKGLEHAKVGTFSILLREDEKTLRDMRPHSFSIMATGYENLAKRLRPPTSKTTDDSQKNLAYAVNLALMERGHIVDAILSAESSVGPGVADSLQTRWINQLNEVAAGADAKQTINCAENLLEMKFDAARTAEDKTQARIAHLLNTAVNGSDLSKGNLTTLVSLWQSDLDKWAVIDHPKPPPPKPLPSPLAARPSPEQSTNVKIASINARAEKYAKRFGENEIQLSLWTEGWKTANLDPAVDSLEKRLGDLSHLIENVEPPAIECPIDTIANSAENTYKKTAEVAYSESLHLSQTPFASDDQVANANAEVSNLYKQINISLNNFNQLISDGADKTTLTKAQGDFLKIACVGSNKQLPDLWSAHLKTLTDRINVDPGADRWSLFIDPGALKEKKLAILRLGFTELDDPKKFMDICTALEGEFNQPSSTVPKEIDNLAWKSWQSAFEFVSSKPDRPQTTQNILDLRRAIPHDQAPPDKDLYNLNLAELKHATDLRADLETLKKLMKPIAGDSELEGVKNLLNPKSKSEFTGPQLKGENISSEDEKIFTLSSEDNGSGDPVRLKFERLNTQGPLHSTCLLSSEVSFGACQLLARACEKSKTSSWQSVVYKGSQSPVPFWKYDSSSNDPSQMTQAVELPGPPWNKYDPTLFPDGDNEATRVTRGAGSPMEFISPTAAKVIAKSIHCRLPTKIEWAEALREEKSNGAKSLEAGYNLRGTQWYEELKIIDEYYTEQSPNFRDGGLDYDFPRLDRYAFFGNDSAPNWTDQFVRDALAKGKPIHDENPLFFRAVGKQPGAVRFSDLIGNVAEFVTVKNGAETKIAVIGGSAISAPEVINPETAYVLKSDTGESASLPAYSDVGFRLAYDDPTSAPLKDIYDAIALLKYRAVSPALTPPPIERK